MTNPGPDPIGLAQDLVRFPSVTPEDAGCQRLIASLLSEHGFTVRTIDHLPVKNLWAVHGSTGPILCLAGHTDVVPPGPPETWKHPPFSATIEDGFLYGRGIADMKGGLAALIVAAIAYVDTHPAHPGRIAFLITSDEEGSAEDGTRRVLAQLAAEGIFVSHVLVGEPSSRERPGDTIRVGRRGSLGLRLTIEGRSGHVAYLPYEENPVAHLVRVLEALAEIPWPEEPVPFPRTTFQVTQVEASGGASNVTPPHAKLACNFRYGPTSAEQNLETCIEQAIRRASGLPVRLAWREGARPYRSPPGPLRQAVLAATTHLLGRAAQQAADGGTSDGRFFAEFGAEVVELGLPATGIHEPNERTSLVALRELTTLYAIVLETFFSQPELATASST